MSAAVTPGPARTIDVTKLPTYAFGVRSTLFWGVMLLCCIEGTVLSILLASYLYLRGNELSWPPSAPLPILPIAIDAGWLVASILPMWRVGHAARALDLKRTRRWQLAATLMGIVGLALHGWVLAVLPFSWTENAYASIVWIAIGTHVFDLVAETGENVVLSAVLFRGPVEDKHFEDIEVNSFFWYFLVVAWLPFAALFMLDGGVR